MNEVAAGIWRVPLALRSVNAYVLRGDQGLTLVDCGYPGQGEPIIRALSSGGYSPSDLRTINLSHGDLDHVGSLRQLTALTGAKVMAHGLEIDLIRGQEQRRWSPNLGGQLAAMAYTLLQGASGLGESTATVDRELADGQRLDGDWQVVHSPGHTPGHICLYQPSRHILFTGDALGQRHGALVGPTPAYAGDLGLAIASVRRLASLQPTTLLFGHRSPLIDVDPAAVSQLAARLERRHLKGPRPLSEM